MNEEQVVEFLKNNLELDIKESGGSYGEKEYYQIELKLKGDSISTIYLDK